MKTITSYSKGAVCLRFLNIPTYRIYEFTAPETSITITHCIVEGGGLILKYFIGAFPFSATFVSDSITVQVKLLCFLLNLTDIVTNNILLT